MGPVMVGSRQPLCCHVSEHLQRIKIEAVQHFGAAGPVRSLDIYILGGIPGWIKFCEYLRQFRQQVSKQYRHPIALEIRHYPSKNSRPVDEKR